MRGKGKRTTLRAKGKNQCKGEEITHITLCAVVPNVLTPPYAQNTGTTIHPAHPHSKLVQPGSIAKTAANVPKTSQYALFAPHRSIIGVTNSHCATIAAIACVSMILLCAVVERPNPPARPKITCRGVDGTVEGGVPR